MKYFKTEAARIQVRDAANTLINPEPVVGGEGVFAVEDGSAADLALSKLAEARKCGIVKISAEIYDGLKKNAADSKPSQQPSRLNQMRVSPRIESFNAQSAARPVAVAAKGITVIPEPPAASTINRQFKPRGRPVS